MNKTQIFNDDSTYTNTALRLDQQLSDEFYNSIIALYNQNTEISLSELFYLAHMSFTDAHLRARLDIRDSLHKIKD